MFGGGGNFNPLTNTYREVGLTENGLPINIESHLWLEVRKHDMPIYNWWPNLMLRGYSIKVVYRAHRACSCLLSEPITLFKAHDSELHGEFPVSPCVRNFWFLQLMRERLDFCLLPDRWGFADGINPNFTFDMEIIVGWLHCFMVDNDQKPYYAFREYEL